MTPLIGITVHTRTDVPPGDVRVERYEVSGRYTRAVVDAGAIPLLLPTHAAHAARPAEVVRAVDGLLLSGGGRIAATYFDDTPNPSLRDTNPARYDYEVALVQDARRAGVPVLGICRGHQTLAEALGGRVVNLVRLPSGEDPHYQRAPHPTTSHAVTVCEGTVLSRHCPGRRRVNSFHRQAVGTVPPGFRVSAVADDGLVEAIEAETGFAVGVQFHPEWLYAEQPEFLELFRAFVAAAHARARLREARPADGVAAPRP